MPIDGRYIKDQTLNIVDCDDTIASTAQLQAEIARAQGVESALDTQMVVHSTIHNGFEDRFQSLLLFNDGTRTLTISPAVPGQAYVVYSSGKRFVKSAPQSLVIPDQEGMHLIYFDANGQLASMQAFSNSIILTYAYVSYIYWDAQNKKAILFVDERHGLMDSSVHLHWHEVFGAAWVSGGDLQSITADGAGNLPAHAQLAVNGGTIRDEDISYSFANNAPQVLSPVARVPVFYKLGSSITWRKKEADDYPLIHSGVGYSGTLPAFNYKNGSSWELRQVTSGRFFLVHLFLVPDLRHPVVAFLGETEYPSLENARTGSEEELLDLTALGLPFPEFVPSGTLIFEASTGFTNVPRARIRSSAKGTSYASWLRTKPGKTLLMRQDYGKNLCWSYSEAESSTTSTVYQQKMRCQTIDLAPGTYRIGWSFEIANSANNSRTYARIQLDDTLTLTEVYNEPSNATINDFESMSGFYYAEGISGQHFIDFDFRASSGTGKIRRARIEIWRVL